jgi:hypothetical protein
VVICCVGLQFLSTFVLVALRDIKHRITSNIRRIFYTFGKLRCVLNSRNVQVIICSLKPTFKNWMRFKFEAVLYSKKYNNLFCHMCKNGLKLFLTLCSKQISEEFYNEHQIWINLKIKFVLVKSNLSNTEIETAFWTQERSNRLFEFDFCFWDIAYRRLAYSLCMLELHLYKTSCTRPRFAVAQCGRIWNERKEKTHVYDVFNVAVLVGIQYSFLTSLHLWWRWSECM